MGGETLLASRKSGAFGKINGHQLMKPHHNYYPLTNNNEINKPGLFEIYSKFQTCKKAIIMPVTRLISMELGAVIINYMYNSVYVHLIHNRH